MRKSRDNLYHSNHNFFAFTGMFTAYSDSAKISYGRRTDKL